MSVDPRQQTFETYERSAEALAEYFQGNGPRIDDIERALVLAGTTDGKARVIELGCGDGRDAEEIAKRVAWYHGVDSSANLINLARRRVLREPRPKADTGFWIYDMLEYPLPDDLDVVFAFASLLHLNRDEVATISDRVARSLRFGGIFYISLKHRPEYTEELQTDQYGTRQFFYYNPDVVRELAGPYFETVYENFYTLGSQDWFRLALRRA